MISPQLYIGGPSSLSMWHQVDDKKVSVGQGGGDIHIVGNIAAGDKDTCPTGCMWSYKKGIILLIIIMIYCQMQITYIH